MLDPGDPICVEVHPVFEDTHTELTHFNLSERFNRGDPMSRNGHYQRRTSLQLHEGDTRERLTIFQNLSSLLVQLGDCLKEN